MNTPNNNTDINQKYEMLLYNRKNRNFEQSDITWKPLISPNEKIEIKKTNSNDIKMKYDILLSDRQKEIEIQNNINKQKEIDIEIIKHKEITKQKEINIQNNINKQKEIQNNINIINKTLIQNNKKDKLDIDKLINSIKNL